MHVSKGTRDQDFTDSEAAAAGAGAGAGGVAQDAQAAGSSSSGAPAGPAKLRSFRLSYEDVVQEEALEEDLDDTVASPTSRAVGLDGSEFDQSKECIKSECGAPDSTVPYQGAQDVSTSSRASPRAPVRLLAGLAQCMGMYSTCQDKRAG